MTGAAATVGQQFSATDAKPAQQRTQAHVYRADVDGLRAIAVTAVLLYHGFPQGLPGGFVGVDVFFVISGFLISGIILESIQAGTFTFADFYARRVRRILPALSVVLAFCAVVGWALLLPSEFRQLGRHIAAGAMFSSNIVLLQEVGYFDLDAELKPLLHLWSLAVEEQYYLVWPWILILARGRRVLGWWIIAVLAAGSFALNLHWTWRQPSMAFYLPMTRLWELLLGSLLAYAAVLPASAASRVHRPPISNALRGAASWLGAAMLGIAVTTTDAKVGFPGWAALLPTVGTALLIAAGPHAWVNRHLLARPLLVWIGLISYPLYLWHWPALVFGRLANGGHLSVGATVVVLLLSTAMAWLTYRFLERPVRRSITRAYARPVVVSLVACLVGLGVFGGLSAASWVKPSSSELPVVARAEAAFADWEPVTEERHAGSGDGVVLFAGDSHMQHYVPRLRAIALAQPGPRQSIDIMTRGGCAPVPGVERIGAQCASFVQRVLARAKEPQVRTVVLAASWQGLLSRNDTFLADDRSRRLVNLGSADGDAVFDRFASELASLTKQGKRVVVLLSSPRGRWQDPKLWVGRSWAGVQPLTHPMQPAGATLAVTSAVDARIRRLAEAAGALVLDPSQSLCNSDTCPVIDAQGEFIFKDDTHLRASFVRNHFGLLDDLVSSP